MRFYTSALLTGLLLLFLGSDLPVLTASIPNHLQLPAQLTLTANALQGNTQPFYRGSGRIEVAYRGSGRRETAYRGSGRIEVAYRGSGRREIAHRGSGRLEIAPTQALTMATA